MEQNELVRLILVRYPHALHHNLLVEGNKEATKHQWRPLLWRLTTAKFPILTVRHLNQMRSMRSNKSQMSSCYRIGVSMRPCMSVLDARVYSKRHMLGVRSSLEIWHRKSRTVLLSEDTIKLNFVRWTVSQTPMNYTCHACDYQQFESSPGNIIKSVARLHVRSTQPQDFESGPDSAAIIFPTYTKDYYRLSTFRLILANTENQA